MGTVRLLCFSTLFLALALFSPQAHADNDWDFTENWDNYSSGYTISSTGSPWRSYSSYNSSTGAFVRYHCPCPSQSNAVWMGANGYYSTSYYDWYLEYKFDDYLPADATLTFWMYIYNCQFYIESSADGVNWSKYTLYSSYTYVYGENKTVTIPAGSLYFRFHSIGYAYLCYSSRLDNIALTVPLVWVSKIGGYDTTGDNAGVLNLTADAGNAFGYDCDKVVFEYKGFDMTSWATIATDYSASDGWSCTWNTGNMVDIACQLRATAYVDTMTGTKTVAIDIKNPVFDSFTVLPELDGQMIPMAAKFGKKAYSLTWPADDWSSSYTGNYIQMVMNAGESAPIAGNYTSYTTYFSYVYTGIQGWHSFKLLDSTAPYFRCIASGAQTNSATGKQTYQLSGTQWSNIPKGVYQGIYVYYANIYNYISDNKKDMYYTSSGNIAVGTAPYWYAYGYYYSPTQATIGGESPYPTKAEFGYSFNKSTVYPVGQANVSADSAAYNWDSTFTINDAEVWIAVRAYNGKNWGGWHFAPRTTRVINRADITINTSMEEGTLIFQGVEKTVPFQETVMVSWESTFSYNISAPEFQLEVPETERWRFDNWTDNGLMTHQMVFTGDSLLSGNTGLTANYTKQYYLETISDAPVAGPEDGYYDVGYKVVSTGQQLIVNEPYRDRRFCIGWEAFGPGMNSEVAEAIFYMTTKTTLVWYYRREFSLMIYNDKGQTTGSLPGWYPEGTQLSVSVNQHITNGLSRQDCRGFTATGPVSSGSTNSSGQFVLDSPAEFHWIWQDQHFVDLSTNFGTTTPAPGWFDSGVTVPINATSPLADEWTMYTFVSWTGTGFGSVTYQGDQTAQTITVNAPITQVAQWDIWHNLVATAENGSLVDDPSGWYLRDTTVAVRAEAPEALTGERWVVEWEGDEPANTIERDPQNPLTVYVTLSSGAAQAVRFYKQYLLTVINPNMTAVVVPAPGYSWHYGGEPVEGNAQFATDHFIFSGYYATGSLASGNVPYFEFIINEPTMISWQWTERGAPPVQFWSMPAEIANEPTGQVVSTVLSDGTPAVAWFSQKTNSIIYMTGSGDDWNSTTLVSDVPGVEGLALFVDENDQPVVSYYSSTDHHLYYAYPVAAAAGGAGIQVMLLDDIGDVGRSPSIACGLGGEIFIAYIDSGLGKVKLATIAGGIATFDVVPYEGTASLYASLTVRPNDGAPVIAFYDARDRALVCAVKEGGLWKVEVVDNTGMVGFFCKAVACPSGEVVIAYQDISVVNQPVVKVARRDYYSWHVETVDTAVSGYYLDMVLDAAARPHIISSNGWQLRYTRSTGPGWESMTIPNPYAISSGISIVMLPEGKPAAFYTTSSKVGYLDALASELVNVGETSDGIIPVEDPTAGDTGGGGGCFVATAAFGSMGVESVLSLTCWRDAALSASSCGSRLRDLYYSLAPSVASRSGRSFASAIRRMLRF